MRIAFALGLNNKNYKQPRSVSSDSPCPLTNLNIWWCLSVMDRRWSFGVGLPYAVAEPQVQTPELPIKWQSHDSPLSDLYAMVGYSRIAGLVWAHISTNSTTLPQSLSKSHRLQESVTFLERQFTGDSQITRHEEYSRRATLKSQVQNPTSSASKPNATTHSASSIAIWSSNGDVRR